LEWGKGPNHAHSWLEQDYETEEAWRSRCSASSTTKHIFVGKTCLESCAIRQEVMGSILADKYLKEGNMFLENAKTGSPI